jgi:hypothetical protein
MTVSNNIGAEKGVIDEKINWLIIICTMVS